MIAVLPERSAIPGDRVKGGNENIFEFLLASAGNALHISNSSPRMSNDPELIGLPDGISAEEAATQFDRLQQKLVPLWRSIESFNQDEQTIVVVPSMTVDMAAAGLEIQAYEERFLF